MQRTHFLKIKNNILELEKGFMQLRKQKQSKDKREKSTLYSKSNNIELMTNDNANVVLDRIFESLFSR